MASKKAVLLPTIVATLIIGTLGLVFIPDEIKNKQINFKKGTIKIDETPITVEIAKTQTEKQRWLMFRTDKLSYDQGLIMVYEKSDLYSLWLLNIQYNLDLLWFDENGKLAYFKKNVSPCKTTFDIQECTYKSTKPALYIMATTAGFIDNHNITENSKMTIISI
ncbi:MAG: hypothetical protein DA328_08855 [Nitrososphaeraceae archaeon]|nr:hypothetical protein [Nitrososphaeraceae archaeon]